MSSPVDENAPLSARIRGHCERGDQIARILPQTNAINRQTDVVHESTNNVVYLPRRVRNVVNGTMVLGLELLQPDGQPRDLALVEVSGENVSKELSFVAQNSRRSHRVVDVCDHTHTFWVDHVRDLDKLNAPTLSVYRFAPKRESVLSSEYSVMLSGVRGMFRAMMPWIRSRIVSFTEDEAVDSDPEETVDAESVSAVLVSGWVKESSISLSICETVDVGTFGFESRWISDIISLFFLFIVPGQYMQPETSVMYSLLINRRVAHDYRQRDHQRDVLGNDVQRQAVDLGVGALFRVHVAGSQVHLHGSRRERELQAGDELGHRVGHPVGRLQSVHPQDADDGQDAEAISCVAQDRFPEPGRNGCDFQATEQASDHEQSQGHARSRALLELDKLVFDNDCLLAVSGSPSSTAPGSSAIGSSAGGLGSSSTS
ncbi:hypothetical protein OGAPHI_001138 [Ogataea philodendri]|uniref:Uncharacterized protein n=1 Tax=Ogataea philodendri TaxID=1378263 RepID=A0A9P8T8T1_9ASCO|nr:uncharacterized protein OGAPHI_001138 [Ogataea philodendri]KAH3670623.1 hypothetical protein OGAPHI_001138 [Ogataea philodendri]